MLDMLLVFEGMFKKSSLNFDLLLGVLWSEIVGLIDIMLVKGFVGLASDYNPILFNFY